MDNNNQPTRAPKTPSMKRTRSNSSRDSGCLTGCKESCCKNPATASVKNSLCYKCFKPHAYGSKVIKRKSKKLRGSKKKRGSKSMKRRGSKSMKRRGSKKRRGRKSVKRRGMKKRRK